MLKHENLNIIVKLMVAQLHENYLYCTTKHYKETKFQLNYVHDFSNTNHIGNTSEDLVMGDLSHSQAINPLKHGTTSRCSMILLFLNNMAISLRHKHPTPA